MLVSNMATYVSVATITVNTMLYLTVNATRFVLVTIRSHVEDCGEMRFMIQVRDENI